jgi:hypothetical protein
MTDKTIETLAATVLLSLAFIIGGRLHRPGNIRRRGFMSFSGGAAVSYIFVHLSPELEHARDVFLEETAHPDLPFAWYIIHLATMLSFVFFYGMEQFVMSEKRKKKVSEPVEGEDSTMVFWIHVGVFGAYAWLVSYLLVDSLETGPVRIGFYAVAMGLHFLSVGHGMHREYGALYDRIGAWVLSSCAFAGWATGMLINLDKPLVAILLGFLAGGVIVNTMIEELPREKEGRFVPFVLGAVVYTTLLMIVYR